MVTVTNAGGTLAPASRRLVGAAPGKFGLASATTCVGGLTLAPGESCTVAVRFQPTGTRVYQVIVRVGRNATGAPHDIVLSGEGI